MIKQTYDELVQKIVEKSNVAKPEIEEKINLKLKQLSGLISKEGAAHIVANQLGIKLVGQSIGKLQIANILTGMREVDTIGRVVNVFPVRQFQVEGRSGQVGSLILGDETATIRLVLWGDQASHIQTIQPGMVLKVKGAYAKEQNGQKELHLSMRGSLVLNPPGESVAPVKEEFLPGTSRKKLAELKEGDDNVEILGTIVQVFEPRFYEVCPACQRRIVFKEGGFFCDVHNQVKPGYSYVINLVLDDGTSNIRVVCFRHQALALLMLKEEEILKFKDNLEGFEAVRTAVLGNITKFFGRAVKNKMFDRLEFISNNVDMNPDPEKELELLNKELAAQQAKE